MDQRKISKGKMSTMDGETSPISQRSRASFPLRHRLLRIFFRLSWTLFAAWTPPALNGWRILLLRLFGSKIHETAAVRPRAKIWYPPNLVMKPFSVLADGVNCYNMAMIEIGENSIVSQGAYLCGGTHDFTRASHPLLIRPITISSDVWIASEAFIGPGVTVPEGCVIGARAVVIGNLEPWTVYAGNPARRIRERIYDPLS